MQFQEYETYYTRQRIADEPNAVSEKRFYDGEFTARFADMPPSHFGVAREDEKWQILLAIEAEGMWVRRKRPVYNIYPCIYEAGMKFDVSKLTCADLAKAITEQFLVCRFPVGTTMQSMLIAFFWTTNPIESRLEYIMIDISSKHGRTASGKHLAGIGWIQVASGFPGTAPGKGCDTDTLWASFLRGEGKPNVKAMSNDCHDAIRMAALICLLQTNPDIVEPNICKKFLALAPDVAIHKSTNRRGGQQIWDVGRSLESVPHYRRPHMATFWTGRGRAQPKVKLRSGCVVLRERVLEVPSEYLGSL